MIAFARRLTTTVAVIVGITLVMVPFALWTAHPVRAIAMVLLWLGGGAYLANRFESNEMAGCGVFLLLIPLVAIMMGLADYLDIARSPHITGISASDAPAYPDAGGFEFSEAVIQTEYVTIHTTKSYVRARGKPRRLVYSHYLVAPLTDASWKPSDPVPAWFGCSVESVTDTCRWDDAYRSGIIINELSRDSMRAAVDYAKQERGLTEAAGAPILEQVESVETIVDKRLQLLIRPIFCSLALFLILAIVAHGAEHS